MLLQESVRDAADLYLSLKYPPTLFVCDTPCGLARHMDLRCPNIANHFWGDNVGCFEKPQLDRVPNVVSIITMLLQGGSKKVYSWKKSANANSA